MIGVFTKNLKVGTLLISSSDCYFGLVKNIAKKYIHVLWIPKSFALIG